MDDGHRVGGFDLRLKIRTVPGKHPGPSDRLGGAFSLAALRPTGCVLEARQGQDSCATLRLSLSWFSWTLWLCPGADAQTPHRRSAAVPPWHPQKLLRISRLRPEARTCPRKWLLCMDFRTGLPSTPARDKCAPHSDSASRVRFLPGGGGAAR